MPIERAIPFTEGTFFITFTCYQWLSLIEMTVGYDLIYKWFDFLKVKGHYIIGYQIMPNHVHVVIAFQNTRDDINAVIGNGKRFIAYGIINRLRKYKQHDTLLKLEYGVNISDRKRGKKHEVWEKSFDWKECRNNKMILQKLDYMHGNACTGKWKLASNPVKYCYSSAKFYMTGKQGKYSVTNYMELEDIDLTKQI